MVGIGVLAISPDALIVRLVKLDSPAIAFWRALLMSMGFLGTALFLYRGGTVSRFRSMGRLGLMVTGFSAMSSVLFVVAVTHTAVSNTLVILAASPVFAALLSAAFLGDHVRRETWIASFLILIGVAAIVGGSLGGSGLVGDLAALAGSLSTAGMLVTLRRHPGADPIPGLALGGLAGAAIVSPAVGRIEPTRHDLLLLMLLGLVLLPIAIGLITRGPKYLTAPEVGLMMLLETLLGPLWVWIGIGERPGRDSLLSGLLIVSVLAVHSTLSLRTEIRAERPVAEARA
ncbi:MAG TPA: DMT family transporter [Gaiellaceae bacterium]|jgi:drug/metabolite transporter (DMT)-like permease|nr:DMT family transporter [Gaiellaceae bacterium]